MVAVNFKLLRYASYWTRKYVSLIGFMLKISDSAANDQYLFIKVICGLTMADPQWLSTRKSSRCLYSLISSESRLDSACSRERGIILLII